MIVWVDRLVLGWSVLLDSFGFFIWLQPVGSCGWNLQDSFPHVSDTVARDVWKARLSWETDKARSFFLTVQSQGFPPPHGVIKWQVRLPESIDVEAAKHS